MNFHFSQFALKPSARELLNFNIFRFIFCFYSALMLIPANQPLGIFTPITFVRISGVVVRSPESFFILKWLLVLCLVLAGVGYRTRLFLALGTFFYSVHFANLYSFLYVPFLKYMPSEANISLLTLLILLLSPVSCEYKFSQFTGLSAAAPPHEPQFFWPKQLIIFSLGWVYFSSFVAKVAAGHWSLFDGEILQMYLREFGLFRGSQHALWLSSQAQLCHIAAVLTLVFEATVLFGFFIKPVRNLFISLALGFHVVVFIFFGIDFLTKFLPVFFVFVDWTRAVQWAAQLTVQIKKRISSHCVLNNFFKI